MAGKPKTSALPLRTDFHDAQVIELLGKLRKSAILEREGERTNVLRRTHIDTGSGSDGRSVKVLTAQIHGVHCLGGIVYKANNRSDGNNNSNYNHIDSNNSATSFYCDESEGLHNRCHPRLPHRGIPSSVRPPRSQLHLHRDSLASIPPPRYLTASSILYSYTTPAFLGKYSLYLQLNTALNLNHHPEPYQKPKIK